MYSKIIIQLLGEQQVLSPHCIQLRKFMVLCNHINFLQAYSTLVRPNRKIILDHLEAAIENIKDLGIHLVLYYLKSEVEEPYKHEIFESILDVRLDWKQLNAHEDYSNDEIDNDQTQALQKILNSIILDPLYYQVFLKFADHAEKENTEKAFRDLDEQDKHIIREQLREIVHGDSDHADIELLGALYIFVDSMYEPPKKEHKHDLIVNEFCIFDAFLSPSTKVHDQHIDIAHEQHKRPT